MMNTVVTPRLTLASRGCIPVDGSHEGDHVEYSGNPETNPGQSRSCIPIDGSYEADQDPVVGRSNEFIVLLYSIDFFFEARGGLIVIRTFYFNEVLIS